jgi:3D (Asp-Asp-Asp) domain-containing protein
VALRDIGRVAVALLVAVAFIQSGAIRLPVGRSLSTVLTSAVTNPVLTPAPDTGPLRHAPVLVYGELRFTPLIVRAKQIIKREHERRERQRGKFDRARAGESIHVSLTQYCLQGLTRRDNYVRLGIVAADPRVFPLARHVEVYLGKRFLGKFLVDDTGAKVKGPTLDIWNPSCAEARRFGRQRGIAKLVVK